MKPNVIFLCFVAFLYSVPIPKTSLQPNVKGLLADRFGDGLLKGLNGMTNGLTALRHPDQAVHALLVDTVVMRGSVMDIYGCFRCVF